MSPRSFSRQQAAVIQSRARTLAVRAFAGAGKTTALIGYAKARPDCEILYVAFNQPIAEEAAGRFPANVHCRTVNSLAYEAIGRNYAGKLGTPRPNSVADTFGVSIERASDMLRAIEAFCISADRELGSHHLPAHCRHSNAAKEVLSLCADLWSCMCDVDDDRALMSHGGYLKLYQLSRPRLDERFDIILFDEYQDANPVIIALVASQSCRKVYVGDTHQSIYAFRGATNALETVRADETLLLTESYRFGAESARLATMLLAGYKGETEALVGLNKSSKPFGEIDESRPYAILCRTNAGLFSRAVDQLDHKRFHLVGGPDGYVFGKVLDVWHLMSGNPSAAKDPFIRGMRTFGALSDYAKRVDDIEIKMLCGIVADYDSMIPDLVSRIVAESTKDIDDAEVILTTAHRSKGLEFEQVILHDDFRDLVDERGAMLNVQADPELAQEVNLLYVALTRATVALQGNNALNAAIKAIRESRLKIPDPAPAGLIPGQDGFGDASMAPRSFFESRASVRAHKSALGARLPATRSAPAQPVQRLPATGSKVVSTHGAPEVLRPDKKT